MVDGVVMRSTLCGGREGGIWRIRREDSDGDGR